MPKRTDLKKILVIGSGPIVIGQAAEFDYAGTQACLALKEEGYEVVLCNSNPATIMTDTSIADKVYMEPLTLEYVAKIVRYERPDASCLVLEGRPDSTLPCSLKKREFWRNVAQNFLEQKSAVSNVPKTGSSSKSSVKNSESPYFHPTLQVLSRRD